jgi:hypothetical protein
LLGFCKVAQNAQKGIFKQRISSCTECAEKYVGRPRRRRFSAVTRVQVAEFRHSITTDSQVFTTATTVVTNIHYHVAVALFSFASSLRERTACAARQH